MLFNSIEYFIFLPVFLVCYFLVRTNYRWLVLLIASYFFYMYSEPKYLFIILFSTIITFIGSHKIVLSKGHKRKFWLFVVLSLNIGLLFTFKYFNFLLDFVQIIIPYSNIPSFYMTHNIALPIGISFYTFQAISYCVDAYRNNYIPDRHFGRFALYISFFPKLLAGPIERAQDLIPQFNKTPKVNLIQVLNGIKRILWGLFKKIVIADKLALIVDAVYGAPYGYNGFSMLLATYLFAFQIYCDFSGYCDIAIGTAQLFGFRLTENFQKPYLAISIADFWKRWHITLMSWFKDYIYIPMGGKKVSFYRWFGNILIVFLLSGLWHGVGLNFIIWGIIHGLFYVSGSITAGTRKYIANKIGLYNHAKFHEIIKIIATFNLVSLGWIFFRADDLSTASYMIKSIFIDLISFIKTVSQFNFSFWSLFKIQGISEVELLIYLALLIFFILSESFNWIERYYYHDNLDNIKIKELVLLNIMIISIVFLGDIGGRSFLYFNF